MDSPPPMPDEYRCTESERVNSAYRWRGRSNSDSTPTTRGWTDDELKWVLDLRAEGWSYEKVAESIGRSATAVKVKVKRTQKSNGGYNDAHRPAKHTMNRRVLATIQPRTVLDCFGGPVSFYRGRQLIWRPGSVVSNDIDPAFADEHDFTMDAHQLLCQLFAANPKTQFDLIDLDPFGSAFDCFDLAVRMASKCLVITFGEMGHRRFKRLDFVRERYGIDDLDSFTLEPFVAHVQKVGRRHFKELAVIEANTWRNVGRVAFAIAPFKKTDHWLENES